MNYHPQIGDIVKLSCRNNTGKKPSVKYIVCDVNLPPHAEIHCIDLVNLKHHFFYWYEVELIVSG